MARLFLLNPKAYFQLRKLGKQIAELKARVHDVGERRLRYDVSVPDGRDLKRVDNKLPGQEEERREAFVRALEEEKKKKKVRAQQHAPARRKLGGLLQDALAVAVPSAAVGLGLGGADSDIIGQLPALLVPSEAATIRGILKKCSPPEDHPAAAVVVVQLLQLKLGIQMHEEDVPLCSVCLPLPDEPRAEEARGGSGGTWSSSKRGQEPSDGLLLQPAVHPAEELPAVLRDEKEISRTSMVRLVGKEPGGGGRTTPEEAGERCFRELLFRGFIRTARRSDAGTIKSCVMDDAAREFIVGITKSENFVADLPAHLDR
jgi:hypothetical protein